MGSGQANSVQTLGRKHASGIIPALIAYLIGVHGIVGVAAIDRFTPFDLLTLA
jgi:hypothetical protein